MSKVEIPDLGGPRVATLDLGPWTWDKGRRGFTLIELALVMAIIALTVAVVAPRLPDLGGASFDRALRRSALVIEGVRARAIAKQRYYRLEFSFEDSRLTASYLGPREEFVTDDEVPPFELPSPVRIDEVETAGAGKIAGGTAFLHLSPRGVVEPAAIHLGDGKGRSATLLPELVTGAVEVADGYKELPRETPR